MQKFLFTTCSCLTIFFSACSTDEPAPAVPYKFPVIEVELTQVGNMPYVGEARCGRLGPVDVSGLVAGTSQYPTLDAASKALPVKTFRPGKQRFNLGPMDVGNVVGLMVYYRGAGGPGVAPPAAGQYLEGEVFADGRSLGTVRLDQQIFRMPLTCYRFADGNDINIYNAGCLVIKPSLP
ncbi:hypothetical protein Q5H92_05145 [Hymenobacter sp. M29]|uniref:Lipoprotein n=1 Tax=Hymenobacter mellowenesis TaxID=3063995 RepID=A0ABT9A8P0_9BACT|nr:hypothetical protein [Hymenobacter sp. M29]MDO7845734.1 hypothetical protein [Hymenobacter sp. M29]